MQSKFYQSYICHKLNRQKAETPMFDQNSLVFNINISIQSFQQENGHSIHSAIVLAEIEKSIHYRQLAHLQMIQSHSKSKLINKVLEEILEQINTEQDNFTQTLTQCLQVFYKKFKNVKSQKLEFIDILNNMNEICEKFDSSEEEEKYEADKASEVFQSLEVDRKIIYIQSLQQILLPSLPQTSQRSTIILKEKDEYYTGFINTQSGIFEVFNFISSNNCSNDVSSNSLPVKIQQTYQKQNEEIQDNRDQIQTKEIQPNFEGSNERKFTEEQKIDAINENNKNKKPDVIIPPPPRNSFNQKLLDSENSIEPQKKTEQLQEQLVINRVSTQNQILKIPPPPQRRINFDESNNNDNNNFKNENCNDQNQKIQIDSPQKLIIKAQECPVPDQVKDKNNQFNLGSGFLKQPEYADIEF